MREMLHARSGRAQDPRRWATEGVGSIAFCNGH